MLFLGIILGMFLGLILGALIFLSISTEEIDKLNARCVELARMVKEKDNKINELDNTRAKLLLDNRMFVRSNKAILETIESNTYGRSHKMKLDKIKELVSDNQSQN